MRINASGVKEMELRLHDGALVSDMMDVIASEWNIPVKYQRLVFRGRLLRPQQHISDLHIGNEEEVILQASLKGGCLWLPTGGGGSVCCGVCNVM